MRTTTTSYQDHNFLGNPSYPNLFIIMLLVWNIYQHKIFVKESDWPFLVKCSLAITFFLSIKFKHETLLKRFEFSSSQTNVIVVPTKTPKLTPRSTKKPPRELFQKAKDFYNYIKGHFPNEFSHGILITI